MCKSKKCRTKRKISEVKRKYLIWIQTCYLLQIPSTRSAIMGTHLLLMLLPSGTRQKTVRRMRDGRFQYEFEIEKLDVVSAGRLDDEVRDACLVYDFCTPNEEHRPAPIFDIDRAGFPNESSRLYARLATSPSKKTLQVLEAMIDHLDEEISIYMKDLGNSVWVDRTISETMRARRKAIANCDRRDKLIEVCRCAIRGDQKSVKHLISKYHLV